MSHFRLADQMLSVTRWRDCTLTTPTWVGSHTQVVDGNIVAAQEVRRYGQLYKITRWRVYQWDLTT